MGLLVRMLEKQKWEKIDLVQMGHTKTPADTITTDLKTSSNTLSLWRIEDDTEILKSVLALAVMRNKITRLDVMIFDETELIESGLEIQNTPENGDTPYEEFNQNHFDIIQMDYEKLGHLSELMIRKLKDDSKCIRYNKAKISEILYNGLVDGNYLFEALSESLQVDLKKKNNR
jgi:hypothetical protein